MNVGITNQDNSISTVSNTSAANQVIVAQPTQVHIDRGNSTLEWGADKLAYIQIDNTGNTPAILQNVTEGLNTSYSLPENVSKSEVYDANDANNLVIAPNSTETYVVPVFTGISPEFNMAYNISIQTADGVQDQVALAYNIPGNKLSILSPT